MHVYQQLKCFMSQSKPELRVSDLFKLRPLENKNFITCLHTNPGKTSRLSTKWLETKNVPKTKRIICRHATLARKIMIHKANQTVFLLTAAYIVYHLRPSSLFSGSKENFLKTKKCNKNASSLINHSWHLSDGLFIAYRTLYFLFCYFVEIIS